MYKKILQEYKNAIATHHAQAEKIENQFSNDKSFINDAYKASILQMCIKYESLTSELEELVFKRNPRYNHPWSNTRSIAKNLNIDISKEYKLAHDSWDMYNSLKHVNDQSRHEAKKFMNKYGINSIKEASKFVMESLVKLIEVFERA